jgi:hypothetical protein
MERAIEQVRFYKRPSREMKRVAAYGQSIIGKDAISIRCREVSYYSGLSKAARLALLRCIADEAITGTKEDRAIFQRLWIVAEPTDRQFSQSPFHGLRGTRIVPS